MKNHNLNIAIFSPNKNPYSETFIQAHKNYLKDKVFYYYGSGQNIKLEGQQSLFLTFNSRLLKIKRKIFHHSPD